MDRERARFGFGVRCKSEEEINSRTFFEELFGSHPFCCFQILICSDCLCSQGWWPAPVVDAQEAGEGAERERIVYVACTLAHPM